MTIVPGRWLPGQATNRRAVGEIGPPNRRSKKLVGSRPRDTTVCAWANPANAILHANATTVNTKRIMGISPRGMAELKRFRPGFRFLANLECLRRLGSGSKLRGRCCTTTQVPPAQIPAALGYSEASAFSRAFKRWSGQTPTTWRAEGHRE